MIIFFFFLVIFNNVLTTPVVTVNIKVKDAPAMPAGIPTTVAYEAILKVPNNADSVIKTLSAKSKATMYLLMFLIISFLSLISALKYYFMLLISSNLYFVKSLSSLISFVSYTSKLELLIFTSYKPKCLRIISSFLLKSFGEKRLV